MQYGSVQILYTYINWFVLFISVGGALACAKEGLEAKMFKKDYGEAFKKMKIILIASIVGVIGSTFVGVVKGYF